MSYEIEPDTQFFDVSVTVNKEEGMQQVVDRFSKIREREFNYNSRYLNEIMAFEEDDEVTVTLILVNYGVIVDSVDPLGKEIYPMEELPYGMIKTVDEYFEGRFDEPIYW